MTGPQQIAAVIKQEILEGVLKPGQKLPSADTLAQLFGVSLPTVRAGLHQLCDAQVLIVQRGRNGGYHVGDFSLERLESSVMDFISLSLVVETLKPEQFLEVRFAHELLCAESAARRRGAEDVARLEAVVEEAGSNSDLAFEVDLEFHRILAEATGNPLIVAFESAMIAVLHRLLGSGRSISPERALGNVRDIIDAVRDGDPLRAREAMRLHLTHAMAHYGLSLVQHAADVPDIKMLKV